MEALATYAQPFFAWLLETTLLASVVICLILVAQRLLGDRLGSRWCHALWLVLLLRMVLPWTPPSPVSLFNLVPASLRQGQSRAIIGGGQPERRSTSTRVGQTTATETRLASGQIDVQHASGAGPQANAQEVEPFAKSAFVTARRALPLLWLTGAVVLGGYLLAGNFALWRVVKREHPLTSQPILELFEACKSQMGIQTIVALVPNDRVRSAALFGFVRPRLLLPREMIETASHEELRYVFLHELAHLRRHDIYLGWLTSLLQVLHWFNPLVWLAFYRMRADRELACDALVLTRTGPGQSREYGRTIVGLLERFSCSRRLPAMAGILESQSQLKRRIAMIARFRNNSYRWSVTGIAVIAALAIISMTDPTQSTPSASPAPERDAPMTMRLVQTGVWGDMSVSPDRRYLCGCGTGVGTEDEITLRELATDEQRTIKPGKRTQEEGGPQCPVMSPDNKRIAYLVMLQERADVYLIEADGSGQRILYPGIIRSIKEADGSGPPLPYPGIVRPIQWFPDGSRFLGLRWPDPMHVFKEIQIVSVSIADGSVQVIKTLTGELFRTTIRLSPDAKYVAYEAPSKDAPAKRDVLAIEIDSQRETLLVGHADDDRLLDWTPDGGRILFTSDRLGPWSIWLLPVAKGQAQGTPELVARSTGDIRPVGFAENGSYYYRMNYYDSDIYTATVDLTTGQLLSAPAPLEAAGSNQVADWSPDGKYLAYCSRSVTSPESRVIRIRSLAAGQERELANKLTGFDCLRWSRDGRSLLASWLIPYKLEDAPLSSCVYRIDAATAETTILLDNKKHNVRMAELSPDGKILYYTTDRIIRREIDTGHEKTIFTYPAKGSFSGFAVSPDGEFVAVGSNEGTEKGAEGGLKKVLLIPSQGGQAIELLRWDQEPVSFITHTAWSPDGKTVLFMLHREPVADKNPKVVNEFWQVSTEGGQPRKIMETDLNIPNPQDFRVHPDGHRIAFSAATGHGELWVMENFLPTGKPVSGGTLQQPTQRWTNSLGMVFVPVKGTSVRFCVWEARVKDFEAFIKATGRDMGDRMTCFNAELKHDEWAGYNWRNPGFSQGPDHPVTGVNWEDAVEFCKWLTEKERKEGVLVGGQAYRLPSDSEWSAAVGLKAASGDAPEEQGQETKGVYPWGTQWPPSKGAGNYADVTASEKYGPDELKTIEGFDDGYAEAAPVGSFEPNPCGLYDMGGNVAEWCGYWVSSDTDEYRSLRGASWLQGNADSLHSWYHIGVPPSRASSPDSRASYIGFRVVLEH